MQPNTSMAFPDGDPFASMPGFVPTDVLLDRLPANLREIILVIREHVYENVARFDIIVNKDGEVHSLAIHIQGHQRQGRPVVLPLPDAETALAVAEIVTRWRAAALATPKSRRR